MDELIGKRILGILLDAERQFYLVFRTDQGEVIYETYGDCCSETWFADVVGVQALLGLEVVSVEDLPMPEGYNLDDGRGRQDVDEFYGHSIRTGFGVCDVVYRNSSNGYYGGGLFRVSYLPAEVELMEIVEDYPS